MKPMKEAETMLAGVVSVLGEKVCRRALPPESLTLGGLGVN